MATTEIKISIGWTAFCRPSDKKVIGYRQFTNEGKYFGTLTIVSKPTKAELLAELSALKYTLPA